MLIWVDYPADRFCRQPLGGLVLEAIAHAFLSWLLSLAAVLSIFAIIAAREYGARSVRMIRLSTAAVWFAPATVLLAEQSPAAVLAVFVLLVRATQALFDEWRFALFDPKSVPRGEIPGLFDSVVDPTMTLRSFYAVFATCLTAHAALGAAVLYAPLAAAGILGITVVQCTAIAHSGRALESRRVPTLPKALQGVAATILMAAALTAGGLAPGVFRSSSEVSRGVLDRIRNLVTDSLCGYRPDARRGDLPASSPLNATGIAGGYPGVILWPEVSAVPLLIAPTPSGGGSIGSARPLGIPFGGEYWMYRKPFSRPPAGAYFQRGSPAALSFRTTDSAALEMEARQSLEYPISARCCGEIRVVILNSDTLPGTVALELSLVNEQALRGDSQVLGSQPVLSTPDQRYDPPQPVSETLTFAVPSNPTIEEFSLLRVRYLLNALRKSRSARIAIERFILAPRN